MSNRAEEILKVGAVFGTDKKMKPVWFMWNRRRYEIKEITYSWMSREGRNALYHFSVTDGNALYELCYNSESLNWMLTGITDSE